MVGAVQRALAECSWELIVHEDGRTECSGECASLQGSQTWDEAVPDVHAVRVRCSEMPDGNPVMHKCGECPPGTYEVLGEPREVRLR